MDEQTQHDVARGLRQGDVEAWNALYEAYAQGVWRGVARLMGGGSADVADVVQDIFLAAARSAGTYDARQGTLWLWLWGIARRRVALHYRRQSRNGSLTAPEEGRLVDWLCGKTPAPSDVLAKAELAALVRRTLAELTAEYQTILTSKYIDGDPVEQIAVRLGSSESAVRSKLTRARKAFRRAFGNSAGEFVEN